MTVDDSLTTFQNKLKQRHNDISHYVVREVDLCVELDEVPRGMASDPLPSESDFKLSREGFIFECRRKIRKSTQCLQLNMDLNDKLKELKTLGEDSGSTQ